MAVIIENIADIEWIEKYGSISNSRSSKVGLKLMTKMKNGRAIECVTFGSAEFTKCVVLIVINRKSEIGAIMRGIKLSVSSG